MQRFFRRENVLYIKTEQLLRQPDQLLRDIQDFMGVNRVDIEHKESFRGNYDSDMASETREQLRTYFAPHNARFSELTGIDVANWS